MNMRKFITETETTDFDFTEALVDLLHIQENEIEGLIEKLDVDELSNLIDACVKKNAESARRIVDSIENDDTNEHEKHNDKPKKKSEEDEAAMAKRLFARRDHRKAKNKRILDKSEIRGDNKDTHISYNIGDPVAVDGEEATVKIPHAPHNTIGVMINGELKMVDKKRVHKLDEAVLGMTPMPGLNVRSEPEPMPDDIRRMRQLAGLRDDAPPVMPPQPPMTPPDMEPNMGMDDHHMGLDEPDMGSDIHPDVGGSEFDSDDFSDTDDDFDGNDDFGGFGDDSNLPVASDPITNPMGDMDDFGSPELEGTEALDHAISEIEALIPNIKISEYKSLVARLKALVSMAESAGRSALAESVKRKTMEGKLPFALDKNAKFSPPKRFDFKKNVKKEDKLIPKNAPKKVAPVRDEPEEGTRKTLMDYVNETEDGMQTIGVNRNDATKALQSRMGPTATSAQASAAFDQMMAAGSIKQQNGSFMMTPMDDTTFTTSLQKQPVNGKTPPTNGMSAQNSPAQPNDGTNTGRTIDQVNSGPLTPIKPR